MRVWALVVVAGLATAATGQTVIDMPPPRDAAVTATAGDGRPVGVGEVALHRYGRARVFPAYTYMSPPMGWPYSWSGWRVGIGFRWGWSGWGWGWPWGWRGGGWGRPWGWGYGFRYPCWGSRFYGGTRVFRGVRFRGAGSRR